MGLSDNSHIGDFSVGDFNVAPKFSTVTYQTQATQLEPRIMRVLCELALANGQVVDRERLLHSVWGADQLSDEVLTKAISLLRSVFKNAKAKQIYVGTVSKKGYYLTQPIEWLDNRLSSQSRVLQHQKLTESVEAEKYYVQGKSLNDRISGDTVLASARSLLLNAITLDPDFAEAHAELANSYTLTATYVRGAAGQINLNKTVHHARRALALKPSLAMPFILLAIAEFSIGKMAQAIDFNIQALAMEPDNSEVVMRLGYFYSAIGLNKKAIPLLEQAIQMDPTRGRNFQVLARAKMANGDLVEAEQFAKEAIDLQNAFAFETYASVAFARGQYDLAASRILMGNQSFDKMFKDAFDGKAWQQAARYAFSPKRDERLMIASMLMDLLGKYDTTPDVLLPQGLLRCGDAENFFAVMSTCLPVGRHGSYLSLWADIEPCRDIYTHPNFMGFAKQVGLQEAWDKHGMADRLS